ncbi:magnesium transporter CorA family protein [Rhizobium alvei]|uniref:Magnesium transporter CorA family protein n=1 Tax=Rhizobium alvei TaxID=1132659 RepID=A0ABT8YG32_9HYPH|nr:magnesium transporter CorA family protein [Rhizobium alvei]MDO6962629.1 magnesium transporter CorA family protein [Rhizobium alvei]
MMKAYRSNGEAIVLSVDQRVDSLPDDVFWLDLNSPTREEDLYAERLTGIDVPTRQDLRDIEPSSRLYSTNGTTYLTGSLICHADSAQPVLADVAFVLTASRLVTVRYDDPRSFTLFAHAAGRLQGELRNPALTLTRLLETITDRTAEILEQAEVKSDSLLVRIFGDGGEGKKRRAAGTLEGLLVEIAHHHRLISKVRDSLVSLARLNSFLGGVPAVQNCSEAHALSSSIGRDIQSLAEHANFISGNLSFMLDASLGLINVEQNAIIKIFSIASVVFLPPTLVASVYGMNFVHMPELQWMMGYPASLLLMVFSAVIPYLFFRWKGWL